VKIAAKDFAEVQAPQAMHQEAGRAQIVAVVGGMLIIVAAGFAGGFLLGQEHGRQKASQAEKQRLLEQIGKQKQELESLKKAARQQPSGQKSASAQVGDLTFYNTLPRQSVTPAPLNERTPKAVSPPPAPTQGSHRDSVKSNPRKQSPSSPPKNSTPVQMYKLQLGSYHLRANAERLRERLIQAGFPARVQEMQLPGLGQWYRVYAGPYPGLNEAENSKVQVQAKLHITGLLLRVR